MNMADLFKVKMEMRNGGLNSSLRMLSQKTSRLPSYLVNKACKSIAIRAERTMPVVKPQSILQELEVSATGITEKGNLSRAKKPRRVSIGSNSSSLGSRIVLAKFYKNSPFNIRTGGVFALSKPNTRGSEAFWEYIADKTSQMTKARRSSSGFFKVCASVVKFVFMQATARSPVTNLGLLRPGFEATPGTGNVSKNIGRLAGGTPAYGDRTNARASFWVAATEPDTKGTPGNAVYRIAQPVWQRAVDDESQSIRDYAEGAYRQAAKEAGIAVS